MTPEAMEELLRTIVNICAQRHQLRSDADRLMDLLDCIAIQLAHAHLTTRVDAS